MTTAIGALLVLLGSAVPATERALQITGTRSPGGPTQHSTSRSLALAQVALGIDPGMDLVAARGVPGRTEWGSSAAGETDAGTGLGQRRGLGPRPSHARGG